ncbi:MAG TPA: DUF5655 domain-containing protein [Candidatus Sulfopaludibacter sp.]|jgi:predicted transport protein|nr:DUF5655 domain-containing protein [Candidatus Sulfopaludibacter sp.]
MPKSPKEMGQAIQRNLKAKSGRTFAEWVELARAENLGSRKERVVWLKSAHKLGTVTAMFIAAAAEGHAVDEEYADEDLLLSRMYGGERAALRPVYDAVTAMALKLGKDVELTVCKTYVGIRRRRQFAMIKPTTRTRVDVGLVLPKAKVDDRLVVAGSIGNDRMTHRIGVGARGEVDGEVKKWLKAAYDLAG